MSFEVKAKVTTTHVTLWYQLKAAKEITEEESRASTDQSANGDLLIV